MQAEYERDRKRELKKYQFFEKRAKARRTSLSKPATSTTRAPPSDDAISTPVGDAYDPDLDDYHTKPSRQLSPMVESPEEEAAEREAKRLRVMEGETADASALRADGRSFSYWAVESQSFLTREAEHHFRQHETAYAAWEDSKSQFLFGVKRNDFHDQYLALEDAAETSFAATSSTTSTGGGNKKGRKEINLNQLDRKHQQKFTGDDGSDEREWKAWLSKEACEVLSVGESDRIRAEKKDLIITTRWVRTNKADGLIGKEFQSKSRLVVQGCKDKALGHYRRDAPTASAVAESVCLAVCAHLGFVLLAKDIKKAYFSGKSVDREIYLSQPRGGLPGLDSRQLLYEFAKQFMVLQRQLGCFGSHFAIT